ncbi:hypothetical protein AB0M39_41500 [Streptomyces sp. NPDC051907]|uniref:hypothetical protein n=1 Tax=Streptomyces sp. NPDC051907 TaxID=3155284 RepID=UPI00342FCAB1
MRVDHVLEWADPPTGGWPRGVDAARLVAGCRGCGSGFLDVARRLALSPAGDLGEVPWLACQVCGREEAGARWAWLRCGACEAWLRAVVSGGS